jgi:predicted phage tail protein
MKTWKGLILGVGVAGLVVLLSSAAFAEGKHHQMDVDVFRKAAVALEATHPDLAAGLTKYADKEAREKLEKKGSKAEKEGVAEAKEEQEMKGQHESTIKLFKESAAALKATHPDLAKQLTKSAEWKEKKLREMKEEREESAKEKAEELKDKK